MYNVTTHDVTEAANLENMHKRGELPLDHLQQITITVIRRAYMAQRPVDAKTLDRFHNLTRSL